MRSHYQAGRPEALEARRLLSFTVGGDYPAGDQPYAVVAADFNGDGRADLAVANGQLRTVSVLLCNAGGAFGGAQSFPSGGNSVSIAAGDFNGDGKRDLVTANQFAPPTLLLGNGDGTFQSPQPVPLAEPTPPPDQFITSYYATDVAVADANADGRPDLLFTGEAQWYSDFETGGAYGYVAASLGNGDGSFSASFGVLGSYNSGVATGDLNGDGKCDLVTADEIRFGAGNGSFGSPIDIRVWTNGADVAVADVNGDGKADVVTANFSHVNQPSVGGNVFLNNGNGTFQSPQSYVSGAGPRSLATADFNGDGKMDLVTANQGNPQQNVAPAVNVCLGRGDGTFTAPLSFAPHSSATPFAPLAVTTADFNLDGRPDIAVSSSGANLRVLMNDGNWGLSGFTASGDRAVGNLPNDVVIADFNADGRADLATVNHGGGNNSVSVLLGSGAGAFSTAQHFPIGVGLQPSDLAAGDLNGDGRVDLVTANAPNSVSLLFGNGAGGFGAAMALSTPLLPPEAIGGRVSHVEVADVNADGRSDLAYAFEQVFYDETSESYQFFNYVGVSLGNGNGTFAAPDVQLVGATAGDGLAVADLNGDGKLDIAASTRHNLAILLGLGNGTFSAATSVLLDDNAHSGTPADGLSAGDFNGDGKADLAKADGRYVDDNGLHYGTGGVSVLMGNGNGTFNGAIVQYQAGQTPQSVQAADFNLDGRLDLLTGNYYGTVSVLVGNGDGSFAAAVHFAAAPGAAAYNNFGATAGDLNNDGRPDVAAISQPSPSTGTGNVRVLLNNGGSPGVTAPAWLAPGSAATWNPATKALTITGTATITADPGADTPVITANGSAAVLTINPSSGRAVHVGGLTLTGGATATLASVTTSEATATAVTSSPTKGRAVRGGAVEPNAKPKAQVNSTVTLRTADDSRVLVVDGNTLTIDASSELDLADNNLILNYSGASPAAAVEALVVAGFNFGSWDGVGGVTSGVAVNDPNFALGVAENINLLSPFGSINGGAAFAGVEVDDTAVLVKYTHRVDLDLDGRITSNDAFVFNLNYNEGNAAAWTTGDFDYDGLYGSNDAFLFNLFYNENLPAV